LFSRKVKLNAFFCGLIDENVDHLFLHFNEIHSLWIWCWKWFNYSYICAGNLRANFDLAPSCILTSADRRRWEIVWCVFHLVCLELHECLLI